MLLPGVHLNYSLYTTAADTTVWGDGTAGTGTVSDSYTAIGLSETKTYNVFGLLSWRRELYRYRYGGCHVLICQSTG